MAQTTGQAQTNRRPDGTLKRLTKKLLVEAGLARAWAGVARRRVPLVVTFHEVTPDGSPHAMPPDPLLRIEPSVLEWVLTRLARRFRFATLEEVFLSRNPRLAAVTFDDGYRGIYRHAFPILADRRIPATIFLVTEHVGTSKLLWWDRLRVQARRAQEGGTHAARRLESILPSCENGGGRIDENALVAAFMAATNRERERILQVLDEVAGPLGAQGRVFLSPQEIREMAADGIQFGAHTRTHPLLTWLDDAALREEVAGSLADVRDLCGEEHAWFAYPDGVFGDRELAAARDAGFRGAVQTWRQPWRRGAFAVPRVALNRWTLCGGRPEPDPARLEIALAGLSPRAERPSRNGRAA